MLYYYNLSNLILTFIKFYNINIILRKAIGEQFFLLLKFLQEEILKSKVNIKN